MFTKSTGAQHPDIIADPLIICEQDLFKNPAKFVLAIMSFLWRSGAVLDHSNWGGGGGGRQGPLVLLGGTLLRFILTYFKYYSFSHFSPCQVSLQSRFIMFNLFDK